MKLTSSLLFVLVGFGLSALAAPNPFLEKRCQSTGRKSPGQINKLLFSSIYSPCSQNVVARTAIAVQAQAGVIMLIHEVGAVTTVLHERHCSDSIR
jgi:hypothetical protein